MYDGLKDCSCEFDPVNHALVAVGFTQDTFIIKNSWGASWGDKGYMTISRGLNTCRVSDYVYYPVVRASDEPTNEPPTYVPTPNPSKAYKFYRIPTVSSTSLSVPNQLIIYNF